MKAIRVDASGGPEVLRFTELPDPAPARGEVLVRMLATGINFIEIYQRKGQYRMPLPFIPGTEGAGTVVAVGDGVDPALIGKLVASTALQGSYAELVTAPASKVVIVPEGIPPTVAAAVMLQGITAHYLATSTFPLHAGHRCLIHAAAGGVGLLLCQIAKMRGAEVIGVVSSEEKARLAREAGADSVILSGETDFSARVRELAGGRGVDVVYDSVGADTFSASLDCLVPRGMMVLFGQSSGPVPPFDPQVLNAKGSLFLTRPTIGHHVATRDELVGRCTDLFGWILDGTLAVRIHAEYPLARAEAAHRELESRRTAGKLLLIP